MPPFKPPKTREGIIKMIVEMEGQRAKWEADNKPKKAEPKTKKEKDKAEPKTPKPKGEPGEASKTLKKVSALKGSKQNAQDAV